MNALGAIQQLREFLKGRDRNEALTTFQERALYELMRAYAACKDADSLIALLNEMRKSFNVFTKSKRDAFVKNIFINLERIPGTTDKQIKLCEEYIASLKEQKRNFLRQRFETRLASLLVEKGDFTAALKVLPPLVKEVKKVDDKLLLVQIFLIESKVNFALDDISKARSSLTAAKTNSNSIYVDIQLQSEIDMQSGMINAHEGDFRTSFSYFFEANEGYINKGDLKKSLTSLQYMILCKIMNEQAEEVKTILNVKHLQSYTSEPSVIELTKIAKIVENKSLEDFSKALASDAGKDLLRDKLINKSFRELENELLEKNLERVIKPYSRVEIERVAELMNMDEDKVLIKLTQMILDKKLRGIIDQGAGELIIYDEPMSGKVYTDSLQLIDNMGSVVNNLIRRAKSLQTQ